MLLLLLGDDEDAKLARLSTFDEVLHFDLADQTFDEVVGILRTPPIFGAPPTLDLASLDKATPEQVEELLALTKVSPSPVVIRLGSIPAKLRTALALAQSETFSTPDSSSRARQLESEAAAKNVSLSPEQLTRLAKRTSLKRGKEILGQLAAVRLNKPSDPQLDVLIGSSRGSTPFWLLGDRLEGSSLSDLLSTLSDLQLVGGAEPIPTLAFLRGRIANISKVTESGATDAQQAMQVTGSKSRPAASRWAGLARTLSPSSLSQLWTTLTRAEAAIKTGADAQGELVWATTQLWLILHS